MSDFDPDAHLQRLWAMAPMMVEGTPHAAKLGMKFVSVDLGRATLSLPYTKGAIGNPQTRVLHGGAVTTLLDQACGLAALAGFKKITGTATLNLSIDYMRPATPGEMILARAHCYKATRHVAFVRATAFEDGREDDPIAMAQASFMATSLGSKKKASS
jgi:uncharacterized protein (TIGR00369 family)